MGMLDNDAGQSDACNDHELDHIIDYLDAGGDRALAVKALKNKGLSQHDSIEFVLRYDNTVWDSRTTYQYEYDTLFREVTTYH